MRSAPWGISRFIFSISWGTSWAFPYNAGFVTLWNVCSHRGAIHPALYPNQSISLPPSLPYQSIITSKLIPKGPVDDCQGFYTWRDLDAFLLCSPTLRAKVNQMIIIEIRFPYPEFPAISSRRASVMWWYRCRWAVGMSLVILATSSEYRAH
ncbi:hypothetical protein GE09DRAFT_115756 [Coniochaeta sp. 2T2.1]|nr:hypothetical protein GE09DRAFT_115756 [Coniochaeta sp. 2T2.1]